MIYLNVPCGFYKLWNKGKHNDRHFLKRSSLYAVYPSSIVETHSFLPDTAVGGVCMCIFMGRAFPPVS